MKKPMYWIVAILLALAFLYVIKNYDAETNSVDTSVVTNTVNVVKKNADNVADAIEEGAEDLVEGVEDGVEGAADLAEGAVDAVEDGVEAAGDAIEGVVEDGLEGAADLAEDAAEALDNAADNLDGIEEIVIENDGYQEFSEEEVQEALAEGKNVALFFHAGRCPSCVALDEVIVEGEESIDDGTVVFKVDYDAEEELKAKYNVTAQHTVVYLDENMEASMLKKGITSLEELTANFGG